MVPLILISISLQANKFNLLNWQSVFFQKWPVIETFIEIFRSEWKIDTRVCIANWYLQTWLYMNMTTNVEKLLKCNKQYWWIGTRLEYLNMQWRYHSIVLSKQITDTICKSRCTSSYMPIQEQVIWTQTIQFYCDQFMPISWNSWGSLCNMIIFI